MTKKIVTILLMVSLTINLAAVFALCTYFIEIKRSPHRPFPPPPHEKPELREGRLKERFNLSDEQIHLIAGINRELHEKTRATHEALMKNRRSLAELLKERELDQIKADSLIKELAVLQANIESITFEHLHKITMILTDEQRKQFGEMLHEFIGGSNPPRPPPHNLPHPGEKPGP